MEHMENATSLESLEKGLHVVGTQAKKLHVNIIVLLLLDA